MIKILIIEDELIIARMYKMILERHGWTVTAICTHTEAALTAFQSQRPDVIILDVTLKNGESGIALCKQLRQTTQVPVIFTTGNDSPTVKQEIDSIGNTITLMKPVNENVLIQHIAEKTGNSI